VTDGIVEYAVRSNFAAGDFPLWQGAQ
jgi:hypothetical protein